MIDPVSGRVVAGMRGADGRPQRATDAIAAGALPPRAIAGMATTIGIVATDAVLTKAQANKLAAMAQDGLARTIDPVHTMGDGDTLFALASGRSGRPGEMTVLGALAAAVTARAAAGRDDRARCARRRRHRARGAECGACGHWARSAGSTGGSRS